jgi:hypothetical protein
MWISWVDNCTIGGSYEGVQFANQQMMTGFDCDEVGELKEYVGCKIDFNKEEGWMKLTQPVLMQSYEDEFDTHDNDSPPRTPATPGEVLQKGDPKDEARDIEQSKYRSGVGKVLHMMR